MAAARAIKAPVFVIVLMLFAALIAREFARLKLNEHGISGEYARDLSYLVVPVVAGILLWPVLRIQKQHLKHAFRPCALSWRIVISGVLIGLLMRIAWWSQLVFRTATGLSQSDDPYATIGPSVSFGCPPTAVMLLGVVVMALLTPLIEEASHRGLLLSALLDRGKWTAAIGSSVIFTAFHVPGSYIVVFLAGLVFAFQYINTGALWFSIVTHATYNGLRQLDWRCMSTQWNPATEQLPVVGVALLCTVFFVLSALAGYWLLTANKTGAQQAPRSRRLTTR